MSAPCALEAGIAALGIDLPAGAADKLRSYLALLAKWNRVYNLTAVREPERMVPQHVMDSLAVVPHLHGSTLLDVGSGAGLPGLPIALACPAIHVTLLEASRKKSAFLRQALIELELPNAEAVCARVETWQAPRTYDTVIARAFSDLAELVGLAGRHVAPGGVLAAMKGVRPVDELARLPAGFCVAEVIALHVPGLGAERHLVLIRRD